MLVKSAGNKNKKKRRERGDPNLVFWKAKILGSHLGPLRLPTLMLLCNCGPGMDAGLG